jgi:hypothetical protein
MPARLAPLALSLLLLGGCGAISGPSIITTARD